MSARFARHARRALLMLCAGMAMAAACAAAASGERAAAWPWQRAHLSHGDVAYGFPVYANHPLDGDLGAIEQIVLIQHGIGLNGDGYFASGLALLAASGLDASKVLLVAPNFPARADLDKGFDDMPLWRSGGADNWASGEESVDGVRVGAFQVLDDLLRSLADPARTPALKRMTLAGHSAGAQMLQRYAALNNWDETLRARGVAVRYVIANPSSFLYFTPERWRGESFEVVHSWLCHDFDDYRYGLNDIVAYGRGLTGAQLFERYAKRDVTYLNGALDDDPRHRQLDKRCGAAMEGSDRLDRGRTYQRYERHLAGSTVTLVRTAYEVVGVGHAEAGMFGSQCGQQALFGHAVAGSGAACTPVHTGSETPPLSPPSAPASTSPR